MGFGASERVDGVGHGHRDADYDYGGGGGGGHRDGGGYGVAGFGSTNEGSWYKQLLPRVD